jgi:hypothetical protein
MVELEGTRLSIPPNALSSQQMITITSTTDPAPAGFDNSSPIYQFDPAGLIFATPATVSIAFAGDAHVTLYWSQSEGTGFDDLSGTVAGGRVDAPVVHFSRGFAGPIVSSGAPDLGAPVDLAGADFTGCGGCGDAGSCGAGLTPCSGSCVDTATNPSNCGACGSACPTGQICNNGVCKAPAA